MRERVCVCVCECVRAGVRACGRVGVRACVCARVHLYSNYVYACLCVCKQNKTCSITLIIVDMSNWFSLVAT